MSSIVIDVPEDLDALLVGDLIRIETEDGRHAMEHKRAGNPDPCPECRAYIRAARQVIETGRLSPTGQAIETTAITLYRHEVGFKDFADAARMWPHARQDQREQARSRAREIIALIDAPFPIYRAED
jgi:hypothetical protein